MAARYSYWSSLKLIILAVCVFFKFVNSVQHGSSRFEGGYGPSRGLLEMNYYGETASVVVCLPGFSTKEADVVCREMGFPSGRADIRTLKEPNRRNLGVCLQCRGDENSVTQCLIETHRFNVKTDVNHVWIDCDRSLGASGNLFLFALVTVFFSLVSSPRLRSGVGVAKNILQSAIVMLGAVLMAFWRSLAPVGTRRPEDVERQQAAHANPQEDPRMEELQREMALLRRSVDVTNNRLDDLQNDAISTLSNKLQRLTTMIAFQAVEKEFQASHWSILIQGLAGDAHESMETTEQLCVTLAVDSLGLSGVSAQDVLWCRRTRETFNADIVISFAEMHQSNRWLAAANLLAESEDQITISPHLPPSLLPLLSELHNKRETVALSLNQRSKPVFQYLAKWPFLELVVNGNTVKRPTVTREAVVQELVNEY